VLARSGLGLLKNVPVEVCISVLLQAESLKQSWFVQVLSLFDRRTATTFLKAYRNLCLVAKEAKAKGGSKDDGSDVEMEEEEPAIAVSVAQKWLVEGLESAAKLLHRFGLRDQPDTVREFAETFAEISSSPAVSGLLVLLLTLYHCFRRYNETAFVMLSA
jgi:hypothetical protein